MVADMAVVTTTTLVVTMVAMLLMATVLLTAMALLTVLLLTAHILLRRLRLRLRYLLPGKKPVYTTGGKKRGLFEPPFLITSKKGSGLSAWRIIQVGLTEHRTHTAYQFQ